MPETIRRVIRGGGTSRRTVLGRLGAAVVGASAATFMTSTAAHAAPPLCDPFFPTCSGGCGSVKGSCCWYVTDPGACRTYRCCDRWDLNPCPCTCRHFVGNFC